MSREHIIICNFCDARTEDRKGNGWSWLQIPAERFGVHYLDICPKHSIIVTKDGDQLTVRKGEA